MEYIKKEELRDGDIFVAQMSNNHFLNKQGTKFYLNLKTDNSIKHERFETSGGFSYTNIRMATSEEKHWLNTCIEQDKFITFEEAMKTFIPEYVECVQQLVGSAYKLGIIYKVNNNGYINNDSYSFAYYNFNKNRFKPSTKEAYDAQFVVKEPEFVLPEKWYLKITNDNKDIINNWRRNIIQYDNSDCQYETISQNGSGSSVIFIIQNKDYTEITFEQFKKYVLKEETVEEVIEEIIENKTELEIWLEDTKALNLNFEDLIHYIENDQTCNYNNIYSKLEGFGARQRAKILFNKWNKEIIEPLPQFKVIESIETITKVENNEGNQFFIGDVITVEGSNVAETIKSFEYQLNKTVLCAVFTNNSFIDINSIEHYLESKDVEPEFTLPEKWCITTTAESSKIIQNWRDMTGGSNYRNKEIGVIFTSDKGCVQGWMAFATDRKIGYTEITFDQFKKYVLKEEVKPIIIAQGHLDQLKLAEAGIPSIVIPNETLLEKAKRLYPIGTKFKSAYSGKVFSIKNHIQESSNSTTIVFGTNEPNNGGSYYGCIYYGDKFAEIIK